MRAWIGIGLWFRPAPHHFFARLDYIAPRHLAAASASKRATVGLQHLMDSSNCCLLIAQQVSLSEAVATLRAWGPAQASSSHNVPTSTIQARGNSGPTLLRLHAVYTQLPGTDDDLADTQRMQRRRENQSAWICRQRVKLGLCARCHWSATVLLVVRHFRRKAAALRDENHKTDFTGASQLAAAKQRGNRKITLKAYMRNASVQNSSLLMSKSAPSSRSWAISIEKQKSSWRARYRNGAHTIYPANMTLGGRPQEGMIICARRAEPLDMNRARPRHAWE